MSRSTRMSRSLAAVALGGLLATALVTSPAAAHDAPKPGAPCAMSGLASRAHGTVYLCRATAAGPTWGRGLTVSRSPLAVADGWVKAAPSGMTSAFGRVDNTTGAPVRIVGAMSPLSAAVQLHEVVMADGGMVMQERPAGFVIPAGGTLVLAPGGNHLMLMKVRRPITPGMLIPLTLVTSTGGLISGSLMAKTFSGAVEDYDPGMS